MTRASHILHQIREQQGEQPTVSPHSYAMAAKHQNPFPHMRTVGRHAGNIARLSLHKYVAPKHARAAKIAKAGFVVSAGTYPINKALSSSAGTIAGLHPEDREKLASTVHQTIKDPELRHAAIRAGQEYMKEPTTLHGVGRTIRGAVMRSVAPITNVGRATSGSGQQQDTPGQKSLHDIRAITPVNMSAHRIAHSVADNPFLTWVAGHGREAGKTLARKIQHGGLGQGTEGTDGHSSAIETASHAARLGRKISDLPIFQH